MNALINNIQAQDEPINRTIKFTHAEDGVIGFNHGATVFGDLFMIGALASTKTIKYNGESLWYEYATDINGLKDLERKGGEAIQTIADTISSLGMMLAYVDRGEIDDKHLSNHAWLIAGLGELLSQLVTDNQDIVHSLQVFSEQDTVIASSQTENAKNKA